MFGKLKPVCPTLFSPKKWTTKTNAPHMRCLAPIPRGGLGQFWTWRWASRTQRTRPVPFSMAPSGGNITGSPADTRAPAMGGQRSRPIEGRRNTVWTKPPLPNQTIRHESERKEPIRSKSIFSETYCVLFYRAKGAKNSWGQCGSEVNASWLPACYFAESLTLARGRVGGGVLLACIKPPNATTTSVADGEGVRSGGVGCPQSNRRSKKNIRI